MSMVRTIRIRRKSRALIAAWIAIGLSLIIQPQAKADGPLKIYADSANWFWSSNTTVTQECEPPGSPLNGAPVCGPVSGTGGTFGIVPKENPISDGHFAVSMKEGDSDMRSFLGFSLTDIPFGSTIDQFVVTLNVSRLDQQHSNEHQEAGMNPPATINENLAYIQACAASEPWADVGGAGGDPPYATKLAPATSQETDPNKRTTTQRLEPYYDCSLSAFGEMSPTGATFSFDITNIAKKWADGSYFNNGLALIPVARGTKPTWTVEFHGRYLRRTDKNDTTKKVTIIGKDTAAYATVSYTAPAPLTPPVTGGTTGGTFVPPVAPPTDGGVIPPPTDGATTPVIAPTTLPPANPVASHPGTPGYVWLLVPLGLLGLGSVVSAIGADAMAQAQGVNRVAGVLRARRLGAEPAISET